MQQGMGVLAKYTARTKNTPSGCSLTKVYDDAGGQV